MNNLSKELLDIRTACKVVKPVLDDLKFGKAMGQIREDADVTIPAMARLLGMTVDDLCKFESGMFDIPIGKQLRYLEICKG